MKAFEEIVLPDSLLKERTFSPLTTPVVPPKDPSANYYEQLCHLSIANVVMQTQIKKLLAERQDTYQKLRAQRRDVDTTSRPRGDDDSVASSAAVPGSLSSALQQKQVRGPRPRLNRSGIGGRRTRSSATTSVRLTTVPSLTALRAPSTSISS